MYPKRQREFRRNENLERLLKEINSLLNPVEERILENYKSPKYPVILIVGCPRAGTTLLMQWLASLGYFAYPTNLLSRFYGAPYIGAKIQRLLTDPKYDFNSELYDLGSEISFSSSLGKTKGALSPNEFWYFWRRFIPNTMPEYIDEKSLNKIDSERFLAELAAVEAVFDKPWAMKGLILEFNLAFLSRIFEKVLFLYIKRHPFYNIQSLLESRVKFFGDRQYWYSVKPREYESLKDIDPFGQVAGQVYFTNTAIRTDLNTIDESRWLEIDYMRFCDAPKKVFYQISDKFALQGYEADWLYDGPEQFHATNRIRLPEEEVAKIIEAYQYFSEETVSP